MKTKIYLLATLTLFTMFYGCEKDNFNPPASMLTGKVVYQNQPVGVRSSAVQLELWQYGFKLRNKIAVYVDQDGTYSAALFNGDYKLVRLAGAPWENQTDTINITVKGSTVVDVPVVPYFVMNNVTIQKGTGVVTATLTVQKVSTTKNLELVRLYLGTTVITDQNNNAANASVAASAITLGQTVTVTATIPAALATADYLFARVGVKAAGIGELYYSVPQKIQLK
jgi:hypothetical protein